MKPLAAILAAGTPRGQSESRPTSGLAQRERGGRRWTGMHLFSKISVTCLIALALSGCALGHSVVSVEPAFSTANPAHGQAVRIAKVSDDRQFTASPPQADMASLQDEDMNNPDIRARAIARKRGGF